MKAFKQEEMQKIHLYILLNCAELQPLVRMFEEYVSSSQLGLNQQDVEKCKEEHFVTWFTHAVDNDIYPNTEHLKVLSQPLLRYYRQYDGYFVNGFKFHTKTRAQGRVTQNSDVCVKGSCYNDNEEDYYGELEDIYEVEYASKFGGCVVVLFKCCWFHPVNAVKVDKHGLVDVKMKSYGYPNDPFVIASQCVQVYYIPYTSTKISNDLRSVVKTKARAVYEVGHDPTVVEADDDLQDEESFFQEHERIISRPTEVNSTFCLVDTEGAQVVVHDEAFDEDNHYVSDEEEEFGDDDEESVDDEEEFEDNEEESDDDEEVSEDD